MNAIIEYIIKANGLLIFFCLFYRLFLQKETFYTINRWYLLGSIALSIIAPFITFTKTVFIEAPKPVIDWEQLATIDTQNTIVKENLFTIENFAIVIIGLISTILVLKTLFQLAQIYHKIKKLPYDATLQVRRSSDENIFSLYPYIVVPNHFEKFPNSEMILAHEQIHIQQKHSFDMIVMQLIRSVFWMNPLLRYLQKDIEVNLEYIVDEHLQTQFDSKAYQLSLLSFQNTTPQPFVNSFNSQLKKRIVQINSKKSNPMKKIKLLLAAPAIVAFFTLFQIETQAQIIYSKENTKEKESTNEIEFQVNDVNNNNDISTNQNENNDFFDLFDAVRDVNTFKNDRKTLDKIASKIAIVVDDQLMSKTALKNFDLTTVKSLHLDMSNPTQGNVLRLSTEPTDEDNLRIFTFNTASMKYIKINDKEATREELFQHIDNVNNQKNNENSKNFTTLTINEKGTNIKFPKNSKRLEDETIVSEDGRVLARIETNDNENKNQTFVVNGKKVSHDEASIFLKNNKNAKTTILNDVIVIESNEIKQAQTNKPLYIVNGKEISETDFRKIQPDDIESIIILKDKNATEKYDIKGKDGVLEIQLKDKPKLDVTVSVKIEKPKGNASEDLALFNEVFNAAKSTKEFETKNIKVSSIKADLVTDKTKYSKKVTYN